MKALVKVASVTRGVRPNIYGGLAGAAVGALSGARKREGESERDRASRVLKRGLVGAGVGATAGSVVGAAGLVKRLRDEGLKFRAKPDSSAVLASGAVGVAGGTIGAGLGVGGGAAVQLLKGKKKGETDAEYKVRVYEGALKGGAVGGALGAASSGMRFAPYGHVDTEHLSLKRSREGRHVNLLNLL